MDQHATVHLTENLKGPGDSRPSALQIIKDTNLEGKLADKVMIITDCSSGLGLETGRAVGHRCDSKGKTAYADILELSRVELFHMDLNSLASVRAAAAEFLSKSKKLNALINNAGVMSTPDGNTEDGFETQFGTNHLAHFALSAIRSPSPGVHYLLIGHRNVEHTEDIDLGWAKSSFLAKCLMCVRQAAHPPSTLFGESRSSKSRTTPASP